MEIAIAHTLFTEDKLDDKSKDEYGYSFWLSVCALVLAAADTVIAALTV
ncbi:unnamed protein product [Cylicostephanus goldi]|uniref:Uncharacterized protein n=1 Tax=Cylicostephanus goldi TaxID=71465 RepID=A0A3P7NM75_CYLGO|nr:unnamed protein product [Cylicostephanus goldi]